MLAKHYWKIIFDWIDSCKWREWDLDDNWSLTGHQPRDGSGLINRRFPDWTHTLAHAHTHSHTNTPADGRSVTAQPCGFLWNDSVDYVPNPQVSQNYFPSRKDIQNCILTPRIVGTAYCSHQWSTSIAVKWWEESTTVDVAAGWSPYMKSLLRLCLPPLLHASDTER